MIDAVFAGLSKTIETGDFYHLMASFVHVFRDNGLTIDRFQIPMNKISGLRHPKYAVLILTYIDEELTVRRVPHEFFKDQPFNGFEHLRNTPFGPVLDFPNTVKARSIDEDAPYEVFQELRADGFTDYAAGNMVLPHGAQQLFSVASRSGFGGNVEAVIGELLPIISLSLYAAYQSNVASALAETYLGARTGENVLSGSMYRGSQESIDAGIMFCDVRGFTAMSERLGAEGVVQVMNDVFQIIEEEVAKFGGEILKFIGDALLVIFPRVEDDSVLSGKMIESATQSVHRVEARGKELDLPLSVGFGCHIGRVLYGNIGTQNRLDFTVMGPAVNLTSRLESMCKSLGAQLTVSNAVAAAHKDKLQSFGVHSVKGVSEPVEIWGVPVNS